MPNQIQHIRFTLVASQPLSPKHNNCGAWENSVSTIGMQREIIHTRPRCTYTQV